jgi:hypothetical protein
VSDLRAFVKESNRIEGIVRAPNAGEMREHEEFLKLEAITVDNMVRFVGVIAPGKPIRDRVGMNVRVGNHFPPGGGRSVLVGLMEILQRVNKGRDAYLNHHDYESLHPFMDGNGRSGRVLWLWQMVRQAEDPYVLRRGFLHSFYYQALQHGGGRP